MTWKLLTSWIFHVFPAYGILIGFFKDSHGVSGLAFRGLQVEVLSIVAIRHDDACIQERRRCLQVAVLFLH